MSSAIAAQIADETYHVIEMRTRRDKVTQVPCRVTNLSSAARITIRANILVGIILIEDADFKSYTNSPLEVVEAI